MALEESRKAAVPLVLLVQHPLLGGRGVPVAPQAQHLAVDEPEVVVSCCLVFTIDFLAVPGTGTVYLAFSFLSSIQAILQKPAPLLLSRQIFRPNN